MKSTILWFRQDLRLRDNPALLAACQNGKILPIYIDDTTIPEQHIAGGASRWWLHQSLNSLNQSLDDQLRFFKGDPREIISRLQQETQADCVYWNRCYEPWRINTDSQIKSELKSKGVEAKSFNGSLLWEPVNVLKGDDTPYKVFTPYYKRGCLNKAAPRYPQAAPDDINYLDTKLTSLTLDQLSLMPNIHWYGTIADMWQPGESGASDRLSRFIREAALKYQSQRDIPSVEGTSKLSPYLHFGELSPNQIWYAIHDQFSSDLTLDLNKFLAELGWREFSYYLLYHVPNLPEENFNPRFNHFPWQNDAEKLTAWQLGKTGVPIIDAGMRELWQTGYMHNRIRMVVGSFLVKNLLIDWRHGAAWFHDCLLDADIASNSASWQWVAGCGADAAPYFRIFNPILQGEKFDKEGLYVKTYCPELSDLPKKYIHKPWQAPEQVLKLANVKLGENYPEPIVDLPTSRKTALEAFAAIKQVS